MSYDSKSLDLAEKTDVVEMLEAEAQLAEPTLAETLRRAAWVIGARRAMTANQADEITRLRAALQSAATRFREYERHHRDNAAHEKADRNREMAEMCEAAMKGTRA